MSEDKGYFVVEFRFPFAISNQDNPKDAAIAAAKLCEKEFGFYPSPWYARVFEYGDLEDGIGIIAEFFSNPSGSIFRRVDENIVRHEELIKKQGESG